MIGEYIPPSDGTAIFQPAYLSALEIVVHFSSSNRFSEEHLRPLSGEFNNMDLFKRAIPAISELPLPSRQYSLYGEQNDTLKSERGTVEIDDRWNVSGVNSQPRLYKIGSGRDGVSGKKFKKKSFRPSLNVRPTPLASGIAMNNRPRPAYPRAILFRILRPLLITVLL